MNGNWSRISANLEMSRVAKEAVVEHVVVVGFDYFDAGDELRD